MLEGIWTYPMAETVLALFLVTGWKGGEFIVGWLRFSELEILG